MADGFDLGTAGQALSTLKDQLLDKVAPKPAPKEWSIWSNPGQPQTQTPRTDAPPPQILPQMEVPQVAPAPAANLRPEQMMSTGQADAQTKQAVYQAIDQASKLNNRSTAGSAFMNAINLANNSHDASLQAMAKVEYGLANLGWGYSEEGFKWILEAGSNNPSLYDSQKNQSFLQRLGQTGMPQSAVDLLIYNGKQDPNWYANDANAAKKLDAAMTGPAFVPSTPRPDTTAQTQPGKTADDPLGPPRRPSQEQINPNIGQPSQAGGWMKEQFNQVLQSAMQEKNRQTAFGMLKQATDMADRSGDKALETTARVETGLALLAWGAPEAGFKWLLDAGSLNPNLYNSRANSQFIQRLHNGGVNDAAMNYYLTNGQHDPNWYLRQPDAAKTLTAYEKGTINQAPPQIQKPAAPALPTDTRPAAAAPPPTQFRPATPFQPTPLPLPNIPGIDQPAPALINPPGTFTPHIKPNPFGG